MIRAIAVDDEPHVLERLERMAAQIADLDLCAVFDSGEACLAYLEHNQVDAVFLDIEMPGMDGLSLADRILDLHDQMDLVFVTAYQEYAVQAFEVQAVDYLLKPLSEERLERAVRRLAGEGRRSSKGNGGGNDGGNGGSAVEIRCFQQFTVLVNGQALSWKHTKARELLAFLVQKRGVPVGWEKIADALWPEFRPQQAHTNFHATSYLLRKELARAGIGQIYQNLRGNYRVQPELFRCDLYEYETAASLLNQTALSREEDRAALDRAALDRALDRALGLYQGDYLEEDGFDWAYPLQAELGAIRTKMRQRISKG